MMQTEFQIVLITCYRVKILSIIIIVYVSYKKTVCFKRVLIRVHSYNRFSIAPFRCEYICFCLYLTAKPEIDDHASSPITNDVQAGQTVQIWCNVSGTPEPDVTWQRYLGSEDDPTGRYSA